MRREVVVQNGAGGVAGDGEGGAGQISAPKEPENVQKLHDRLSKMENMLFAVFKRIGKLSPETGRAIEAKRLADDSGDNSNGCDERTAKRWRVEGSIDLADTMEQAMKKMFQVSASQFRSTGQERAVRCVMEAPQDAMIIIPTNSGKSLVFMLPAFVRDGKICTVIVWIVALQEDLMNR